MIEGAYIPGYLVYLLEIFVPGIGLGELLGAWKRDDRVVEKVAFAFGLGLAFDTLVIMVRTSGLRLPGLALEGLEPATLYFIIAAGIAAFIAAVLHKRRVDLPGRPTATDFAVLLCVVFEGVVVFLWLEKYPIFPGFDSPDYAAHVGIAQGLISGTITSIPGGALYFGIHYQLASAFLLVGGEGLVTAQLVVAMLVVLAPLLVYSAGSKVFSSVRAGLAATGIFSLSGAVWFNSVFTAGLYANLFGILATLFFLVAFIDLSRRVQSPHSWSIFVMALVMLYFSHYSSITILPALLVVGLWKLSGGWGNAKGYIVPTLATLAPGLAGVVVFPNVLPELLSLGLSPGGLVVGGTSLSAAVSSLPVLSYMALEVSDDVAFVVILALAAFGVYKGAVSKKMLLFLPLFWLLSLGLVSAASTAAYRLSFAALLPLTLMAGYGVARVVPEFGAPVRRRRKGRMERRGYRKVVVVLVVLLTPIVVNSWSQFAVSDALTDPGDYSRTQRDVYTAMYWLRDNTPANSTYLSVTDWRFVYTQLFFGRTTNIAPVIGEKALLLIAKEQHDQYLIVTFYITVQAPASALEAPWNRIQPGANLILAYSNEDVKVYKLSF